MTADTISQLQLINNKMGAISQPQPINNKAKPFWDVVFIREKPFSLFAAQINWLIYKWRES